MVHDFNMMLLKVREHKKLLHDFLLAETQSLVSIHGELEPQDRKNGPEIFEFGDYKDYPEEQYIMKVVMPDEEHVTKIERVIVQTPNLDLIQRQVLLTIESDKEDYDSTWEIDMAEERYRKKLSDQTETIKRMEVAIQKYDDELKRMKEKRIGTTVNFNLFQLHLLTLNQELMILKTCESKEDALTDIVHSRTMNLMDMQDTISNINNMIESCKKHVEKLQEKEKDIQRQFINTTSENKFFDFLRRVFKKKYRPPKTKTNDDSESESSSSSSDESEDEDAGSIDSKDFGIIRLDENVCPKGCDQNIYDFTFQLRNQRHGIELEIKEETIRMESMRKDSEGYMKKMRVIEFNLNTSRGELEMFQREKQHKLNEIFCTIILKIDQFQHLKEDGTMNTVRDSLVVTKQTLSSLYRRVGELSEETIQQLSKHRLSVSHLTRMKTDLNHMVQHILKLKANIKEEMTIRFGGQVKVHELDEYILKRLVFDLKLTQLDITSMFIEELNSWLKIHKYKQNLLFKSFRSNTSNMELVSLLTSEKSSLKDMFFKQGTIRDKIDNIVEQAEQMKNEIKKLEKVVTEQNTEIEILRSEIKIFRTKGFAPKQVLQPSETADEVEEEDAYSAVSEWEYVDDYMYTENYAREYWASKGVREATKTRQETIISIMEDLFKNINIELERHMVVNLLKKAISDVLNKCDIEDIISNILSNIPGIMSDEQHSLIELTAEKLCSIEELNEGEGSFHSKEILIDIIQEIINRNIEDPEQLMTELVVTLVKNLPLHIILDEENMNAAAEQLKASGVNFNQPHLIDNLTAKVLMETLEARTVLSEILDRVYGDSSENLLAHLQN